MRARAAYIRSIGTTGILVVAALLMLGVVGALVGFHAWPDGAVGETVPSVPVEPAPKPLLTAVRGVRRVPAVTRKARLLGDRSATVGLVKQVPVGAPAPVGYPIAVPPGQAAPTPESPSPAHGHGAQPPIGQPVSPSPPPPADPEGILTLVTGLAGSLPPPPGPSPGPELGQPLEVGIPILGTSVSVPPQPAR